MERVRDAKEAVQYIKEGDTVLVGGFGLCGTPFTLIDEMTIHTSRQLTVISNNLGEEEED